MRPLPVENKYFEAIENNGYDLISEAKNCLFTHACLYGHFDVGTLIKGEASASSSASSRLPVILLQKLSHIHFMSANPAA
jgi:hypothetical protein